MINAQIRTIPLLLVKSVYKKLRLQTMSVIFVLFYCKIKQNLEKKAVSIV